MTSNINIYRCYNECLKNFLLAHGIRYFLVAKDIVTNKKFYAFEKNKYFFDVISKWEENNPKNKH